jgi:hypothetical protein
MGCYTIDPRNIRIVMSTDDDCADDFEPSSLIVE